jgi:transcriptional regulator with XRE-family HTH domain
MDATERVRERVRDVLRERRVRQTAIATRLDIEQSAVHRYIHGPTPMTVAFLEAVESLSGVPMGEIVSPKEDWKQVNADEAALLRALRRWPATVTRSLGAFLAFFADEEPVLRQTRNLHELWRSMPQKRRDEFYAMGVLLAAGRLEPDLLARLMTRLEAEQRAFAAKP